MPVILDESQAPSIAQLLLAIPESGALVSAVEDGRSFDARASVRGIGPLGSASPAEISFIVSSKYQAALYETRACAVILSSSLRASLESEGQGLPFAQVVCEQPYLLYALIARWFDAKRRPQVLAGVHPSALVDPTAHVAPTASVGPHVVVGARAVIGERVQIAANVSIAEDCQIGSDTLIRPNVTLYDHVVLGDRCIVHSGVVLGADGFGFAPNPMVAPGAWGKIAQLGGVRIGHDVEIGANTTIDRGALDDTVIGNGVKLDNQIMIAHNCQVGDHTAMAACVGIAGSTKIGARCTIGGAAMLSGHLTIADDVHISGGTAITANIAEPGRYTGVLPFASHASWQRNAAVMGQLSDLRKRLRQLERK